MSEDDLLSHLLLCIYLSIYIYYVFIYFWLCSVFAALHGFSLVIESRGYSLAAVHGLVIAVASLVAEYRL